MEELYINLKGYKIRYLERGQGAPLILLHGFGGSLEWWKFNLDALSRHYRVIAFDFPGFGLSSKNEIEFTIEFSSKFMLSFLNAFNLPQASLVGSSLGGLIAFHAASEMPERIDRLILVNNPGFGQELSLFLCLGSVFPIAEFALAIRNHFTAKLFLSRLFYDPEKLPSDLIDCVLKIFSQPQAREICLQALRYGVNTKGLKEKIWLSTVEKASRLPHPTLIIWGANDKIIPLPQAYAGKNLIKNSRLCVFKRCGHLPQVEWPVKFNRLVLSFFGS